MYMLIYSSWNYYGFKNIIKVHYKLHYFVQYKANKALLYPVATWLLMKGISHSYITIT